MQAKTIYSNEETNELILSVRITSTRTCKSYIKELRKCGIFENDKELLFKASLYYEWGGNIRKHPSPGETIKFQYLVTHPNSILIELC
jgi:hypothetical protein